MLTIYSLSVEKPKVDCSAKMDAMKMGYGAFVKKGTASSAVIFKPSVPARMSDEPDLFDSLMRITKESSDKHLMDDGSESPVPTVNMPTVNMPTDASMETVIGPQMPGTGMDYQTLPALVPIPLTPSMPTVDTVVPLPDLMSSQPAQPAEDAPAADASAEDAGPAQPTQSGLQLLKPLAADRTSAILEGQEAGLSEGECSDSEGEQMES